MAVSLVDVSSRKVIRVPLVVKETGARALVVTVQQLMAEVETRLTCEATPGMSVRVAAAAVGRKRINLLSHLHSIEYYLLDSSPWFIKTVAYESAVSETNIDLKIHLSGECGATVRVNVEKERVKDLKRKLALLIGVSVCDIQCVLNCGSGRILLENERRLLDYGLVDKNVVTVLPVRRRKDYMMQGIPLEDVSNLTPPAKKPATLSPAWKRVTPGMWLEGICTNKLCVAFMKAVVMNQGFTDLDFLKAKLRCKCPMCYGNVIPDTCGFNRCEWMVVGRRKRPGQVIEIVRQNWQKVDSYTYFIPEKDQCSNWLELKIASRNPDQLNELCVMCMENLQLNRVRAKCGHQFHRKCLYGRSNCIECFAGQSMTDYQMLYF